MSGRLHTQEANRQAAMERLERLIAQAAVVPRSDGPRGLPWPPRKRLEGKRTRSGLKNRRRFGWRVG